VGAFHPLSAFLVFNSVAFGSIRLLIFRKKTSNKKNELSYCREGSFLKSGYMAINKKGKVLVCVQ